MDEIDEAILNCLRRNARMSASRIGQQVNLSVSAVLDRIHRMEEQKVITRYTVVVDQAKLGRPLTLLMGVSMEHPRYHSAFKQAIQREKPFSGVNISPARWTLCSRSLWPPMPSCRSSISASPGCRAWRD